MNSMATKVPTPAASFAVKKPLKMPPMTMKGVLGGMRMPGVPPAAMQPVESESSQFRRRIAGSASVAIVAAVAGAEPQMAEKPALVATAAAQSPPFVRPRNRSHASNRPWLMPEWWANWPMRTKSGMTLRE